MKKFLWLTLIVAASVFRASATEAILTYDLQDANTQGLLNWAGFEFTPSTNIIVSALGYEGPEIASQPYQVGIWDLNGVQISLTTVSTNNNLVNLSYYASVTPVTLFSGTTYFIGAGDTNTGAWNGNVLTEPPGDGANGTFSVSTNSLEYVGAAWRTSSDFTVAPVVGPDTDLLIGPNFEYSVIPEPATMCLTGLGLGAFALFRRRFPPTAV